MLFIAVFAEMMLGGDESTASEEAISPLAQTSGRLAKMGNSTGGYHLQSGDWWEPQRPYSVSSSDWDGDGVINSDDDHIMDPALPPGPSRRGLSCLVPTANCVSDPPPAPFNSGPVKVIPQGSAAIAIDWADVDKDGDMDLAIGNNGAKNEVYMNQGAGFDSAPSWSSSDSLVSIDIAWGDYDSDGDADLAVANFEGPIQIFENQGGNLSKNPFWSHLYGGSKPVSRYTSLDWGDIDGDNDLDLIAGVLTVGVVVFENSGTSFGTSPSWQGGYTGNSGSVMDVKLADIDGDGDLDLIEAVSDGRVSVHLNSGTVFASSASWQSPTDQSTSSVAVGDIDADGDMDLIVGNRGGVNQLFRNNAGILSSTADWQSSESVDTMDVRLADIDSDGDLDLLESNSNSQDNIRIFETTNKDGYGPPEWSTLGIGDSSDSAFVDIDGDGDIDFATADGNDGPLVFINGGQMLQSIASWNDGAADYTYSMDLGDMDGDGDLDLLIGNKYSASKVYEFDNATQSYSPHWFTEHAAGTNSGGILWYDFDTDGKLDVIIGNYNGQNHGWTRGENSVSSSASWVSQESDDSIELVAGDVNGDERADLVVVNHGENRIYLVECSGGSSQCQTSDVASWSSADSRYSNCAELADFDGDGALDMFVANYGDVDQIFFNTGTALSTSAGWASASSMNAQGCDVGDVDGDGDVDIVVANENQANQLYLNPGNGNFPTAPSWQTTNSLDTVSIGLWDVDNDGDLDMVEGNYQSSNHIRMNQGGNFSKIAWTSPDILDTWVLKMGDINADGALDLAVANEQQTNQVFFGEFDQDGDWVSEPNDEIPNDPTQISDQDNDGFGDRSQGRLPDGCTGYWGDSWRDRFGCPDLDGDGQSDLYDSFLQQSSQWSDIDEDGRGDNWDDPSLNVTRSPRGIGQWVPVAYRPDPSPWDSDNDGYEDQVLLTRGLSPIEPFDDCPDESGTSTQDLWGCRDIDGDGWSDEGDSHRADPTQHSDHDGDGYGDAPDGSDADRCPMIWGNSTADVLGCVDIDGDGWSSQSDIDDGDASRWSDLDGDTYSDQGDDDCPSMFGNSTNDRSGCIDLDGDGWSNPDGQALASPLGSADSHPNDPTQWDDSDGDGFGDRSSGHEPDSCPDEYGESSWRVADGLLVPHLGCRDGDGDGVEDASDDCPSSAGTSHLDRWACPDEDGDGWSDLNDDCATAAGDSSIEMIACPDTDGDGIPDLIDPVPNDGRGTHEDWDADGWPNPLDTSDTQSDEDHFPFDPTQWSDLDGDGLGDEANGTNPDPFPGDHDNDGVVDEDDSFPDDPREWSDFDGDGIGDNADTDDDGDGYPDTVELREGTNPLRSDSAPIQTFEMVVPGTSLGLGAWDILGILAGAPLAAWFALSMITRESRTRRFEERLGQATSEHELSEISSEYERALMMRMIGAHQALRLERMRSKYENQFGGLVHESFSVDKSHFGIPAPPTTLAGTISSDGYEWLTYEGEYWYRTPGISAPWKRRGT